MADIEIRTEGRAGRITLTRPQALNSLTYEMCLETEKALDAWRDDEDVALVILDAEGEKAFCAGGDIAEMHRSGSQGDYAYGRTFWRDEYRMNAKLAEYPKPIVSFMQGFCMGGGVGLGGHCSHRIVGDTTKIAMPECGIGFVPDVGGTFRLARAPGRLGEYLGLTGTRMAAGDAIHAGFADHYLPEADWPSLIPRLCGTGDATDVARAARPAPVSPLGGWQPEIDRIFAGASVEEIAGTLRQEQTEFAADTLAALERNCPLSMALTLEMVRRLRTPDLTIREALTLEYRVSHRIMEQGDFLEGVRSAIIDKDRAPNWSHSLGGVPSEAVTDMLRPLGEDELQL